MNEYTRTNSEISSEAEHVDPYNEMADFEKILIYFKKNYLPSCIFQAEQRQKDSKDKDHYQQKSK